MSKDGNPIPNGEAQAPPAERITVLLVDDQAIIGEAVRRQLASEADIAFHYCPDPALAQKLAAEIKPTVILQDLVMPGIDGMTLVVHLRANPATRDIPIIVLSTKEDPAVKSEAFAVGASDYLVKLPDRVELIARIRHHSRAYLARIQRDEAYRALHESERQLKESNASLLALNQKLEEAIRAKSQFLATMSHEIRTPMNAVIGITSFVLDTEMTEEQREFIQTIRSSGEALLAVINDILDFTKIESGRMDIENHPFDLRQCLEETLDLLGPQAAEKNLDLACFVDDAVPARVSGDSARLRQILLNLAGNAVKFTARGEVTITVGREPSSPSGAGDPVALHFAVSDTGIGIPKEKQDRLFKSFSQVDISTARLYGGSGLGLAISQRLAELMHGRMWVESEERRGSTFHFIVKLGPEEAETAAEEAIAHLAGRKILVVDDHATSGRVLTQVARKLGLTPHVVTTRADALAALKAEGPFALAILDQQLPGAGGIELAGEIHRLPEGRETRLILLSSARPRSGDTSASDAGVASFIYKPIRRAQVREAIILALEGPQPAKKAGAASGFDRDLATRLPLRLLVSDDDPVNLKVARTYLGKMGYTADAAHNGVEVLRALEAKTYDLVFIDVQMPEMDGYATARQIGERWKDRRPRLIALTGHAMAGDREKCLEAGMDDYLSKPIRPKELEAMLLRWGRGTGQA